jgi:hypothetical protein
MSADKRFGVRLRFPFSRGAQPPGFPLLVCHTYANGVQGSLGNNLPSWKWGDNHSLR